MWLLKNINITMNKIQIQTYRSAVGDVLLGSYEGKLCLADWKYRRKRITIDKRIQKGLKVGYIEESSEVIRETIKQMKAYFAGERKEFTIPLLMVGTEFQQSVWNGLIKIPYGTTASYLELSKNIGNEKAVRAVASANGANAISILIPCHRIIGSNGALVGYAGGLPTKKKLLELESNLFST
jgi:methylated-DNA-[protein]-cysteine S-methyltransferase